MEQYIRAGSALNVPHYDCRYIGITDLLQLFSLTTFPPDSIVYNKTPQILIYVFLLFQFNNF
uniref:Uncharacterized protein n=1 Tax=Heterorhabditis bacteriophora TaxID=37862 RepID=A0A1I7WZ26_HETBA